MASANPDGAGASASMTCAAAGCAETAHAASRQPARMRDEGRVRCRIVFRMAGRLRAYADGVCCVAAGRDGTQPADRALPQEPGFCVMFGFTSTSSYGIGRLLYVHGIVI